MIMGVSVCCFSVTGEYVLVLCLSVSLGMHECITSVSRCVQCHEYMSQYCASVFACHLGTPLLCVRSMCLWKGLIHTASVVFSGSGVVSFLFLFHLSCCSVL